MSCGANPKVGNKFCANCGQPVNENQVVCLNCGCNIKGRSGAASGSTTSQNGKYGNYDKNTLGIIALLVGGFGIHNFMLGETKKGILKIVLNFCCCIGAILAIIDAVRLFTGKYEVDPEKFF